MIEINKSLHGANGKIKAVYLGTTPVVMYLGNQLLYDVDLDAEYVLMDIEDGDTIDSTIEAPVKSAILKGSTKYRDIDTGDILDTFDETKNLELVSVKMPVLKTVGKNLFDLELVQGSHGYGEVGIKPNFINGNTRVTNVTGNYIKVNPNTKITFSISNDIVFAIAELDINGYGLGDTGWVGHTSIKSSHTITTKEKTSYIGFNFRKLDNSIITAQEVLDSNPMLEISDTATTYEPFKSNILTVNEEVELRGIGKVRDELNLMTGEVTQRIDEYSFNGSENWLKRNDGDGVNTISFHIDLPKTNANTNNFINNIFNFSGSSSSGVEGCAFSGTLLMVQINRSRLDTVDLEGFRKWLQTSNFKVQVPLKENVVKTVVLTIQDQDNKTISTLNTFNDTTHFTVQGEDGSLQPIVSMEIACNPSQSVMALADQTEQLQQEQQELTEQIEQQEQDTNILQTATTDLEEV